MDTDLFFTHTLNLLVHTSGEEVPVQVRIPSEPLPNTISLNDMFRSCHGGKEFHRGVMHTWKELNARYPGHKVPIRVVADLVRSCPVCQKVRLDFGYVYRL